MASQVHVKLDYNEALDGKRNLLSSEVDILNLLKNLHRYIKIKQEKQQLNSKLGRGIRRINLEINFLKKILPQPEEKYIKEIKKEKKKARISKKEKQKRMSIEEELDEINKKLRELG